MPRKQVDPESKRLWEEFNAVNKTIDGCNDCIFLKKMIQGGYNQVRWMGFYSNMGMVARNIEIRHCPSCGRKLI